MTEVGRRLNGVMPGDKHRNLKHRTSLRHEDMELMLLPVWVLAVRYHPTKAAVRLLVNGQTGRVNGRAPTSWLKVGLAVIAIAGLVMTVVASTGILAEIAQ